MSLCSLQSLAENESKPDDEISVVVMGDSLSAAYYIPLESGWVNLMREKFTKNNMAVKVTNGSISGATTAAGLQALPALLKRHKPDIVVLELGGNDGLQGKPVDLIKSNLATLISMSQQSNAQVILVGMRLPPNLGARYTEPFYNQYAALAETFNLSLVPFLLEGVAQNRELMQEDGIHPTAEAQSRILDNVYPVIFNKIQEIALERKD